jgi:hypothetical protein
VKRTQLYLDEPLYEALRVRAGIEKTTISELVRRAAREAYLMDNTQRRKALLAFAGMWEDRSDLPPAGQYVRELRKGSGRRARLGR